MSVNETFREIWHPTRAAISSDDTLVSAAVGTMKFANIPSYAFKPNTKLNAIEIAFTMGADAQSCAATVFAARRNGDIAQVWTGTITAGTQQATDGGVWVDTFGSTTATWATTPKEIDASGGNRMARLMFDTVGYDYFFVQFTGLSGETVKAFFSGF